MQLKFSGSALKYDFHMKMYKCHINSNYCKKMVRYNPFYIEI